MTSVRAQKDLILLYNEDRFKKPTQTIEWLNQRGWVSAHHHVCRTRFKSFENEEKIEPCQLCVPRDMFWN